MRDIKFNAKYFIKIILILLLLFSAIEAFYVFCLPKIIDIPSKTNKITALIEKKTKLSPHISDIELKTHPNFSFLLKAKDVSIADTEGEIVFQAENPLIQIQPLALIKRELNLQQIKGEKVSLNVTRLSDKTFDTDIFSFKNKTLPVNINLSKADIEINGYKLCLEDKFLQKNVCLEGSKFNIKPVSRKISKLATDGKLSIDNQIAAFNLNVLSRFFISKKLDLKDYSATGEITNINLQTLSPYLKNLPNIDNTKGIINIKISSTKGLRSENISEITVTTKDIAINENNYEKQILARGNSELTLRTFVKGQKLNIEKLTFNSDKISLTAQGTIEKYNKDKPLFNISVNLAPSKAENIINLLPFGICKEINIVKKNGLYADVEGDIKIHGKLPSPKLSGEIKARNAHAIWDMKKNHNAEIDVILDNLTANMDIKLETDDNQKFFLNGTTSLYDEDWSIFDISTTDALDLKLVQAILVPVSEIFDFPIGPVPQLTIFSGTGCAKMRIKGKKHQKQLSQIDGFVKIKNGSTVLNGIDAFISNLNLDLIFIKQKINFVAKSAKIEGCPAQFTGISDTYGNVDFDISSANISASILQKIINNSPTLKDIKPAISQIRTINGFLEAKINLKGAVPIETKNFDNFIKTLDTNGYALFKNNNVVLRDFSTPITNLNGKINFTKQSAVGKDIKAVIGKSTVYADINSTFAQSNKQNSTEIKILGKSVRAKDIINFVSQANLKGLNLNFANELSDINANLAMAFGCKIINDTPDLKTINAVIDIFAGNNKNSKITASKGHIKIQNNTAEFNNLDLNFKNSHIGLNGQIRNVISQNPIYYISAKGSEIEVSTIKDLADFLPENTKSIIKSFKDYGGTADFNLNLSKYGAKGFLTLKKLAFRHIESDIPFYFEEIPLNFTNNKISIINTNGQAGRTNKAPLFFNLHIDNYMKIPIIKGTAAVKITPAFIERYVNSKLSHPVKITGDIAFSTELNGSVDSLKAYPVLKINKDADISYLSSSLGDTDLMRVLNGEITILPKNIILNNLEYTKYAISSDNKTTPLPMWNLKGKLNKFKNTYEPSELAITTYRKNPAKLLNFIFKKSLIKSGEFTCNLSYKINGGIAKISGITELENANIPLYNTIIKRGKIFANNEKIYLLADGKTAGTNYSIGAEAVNSFFKPIRIKFLNINTRYMDLERLANLFNQWSIDAYINTSLKAPVTFDISDVIIEKGILGADTIAYKTSPIENFSADFSLDKNSLLHFSTKDFFLSDGKANGTIDYDFKSGTFKCGMKVRGINAEKASEAFFGLKNQITGRLDGNIDISTFGANDIERIENLNGKIGFHIENGSMPKLGSVEYLLRATNLFQSALTTLSINNIIELLKPFKSGSFSKISGVLYVNDGSLKDIAVFSQGKTLSIYLTGDYDIAESNADLTVYGKLGKKTEGLLGPIGNISANTLFSIIPYSKNDKALEQELKKVPDIDYQNQDVKFFKATVQGDINNDKVSNSFKWVK